MEYTSTFKRSEIKFMLDRHQAQAVKAAIGPYLESDRFGKTTISNIYFDTPDGTLARRSIEKPIYKEKLRTRSYKTAGAQDIVFVELKKKFKGIVYKRRASMTESQAEEYLATGKTLLHGQIISEIDYFMELYPGLAPAMFISYEREAFLGRQDSGLRVTFDSSILYRNSDLSLRSAPYGDSLLGRDQVLMEIKAANAFPLWLSSVLTENHIYKTSFSKYGNAYLHSFCKGEARYA